MAWLAGKGVYQGEGEVYRERDPHPLPLLLLLLRGLFPVVPMPLLNHRAFER